jgi:hypothetical protein
MTTQFTVGLKIGGKPQSVTVTAEDALIAALKVKHEKPDAVINYVRKRNARGCPSSKTLGALSLFRNGGSGSSWFDVKRHAADGSSGGSV